MKNKYVTVENALYLTAFILAAGIRFARLGRIPLSDYEASLALQAFDFSKGSLTQIGPQPFYILWTGVLFFFFTSTSLLARTLPALAGSMLVLAPGLYQRFLGRRGALILSFCLAIAPELVGASRQADGLMLSLCFLAFAIGFLLNHQTTAAGIFGGLALLSGPTVWMALLALAVVTLWTRLAPIHRNLTIEEKAGYASLEEVKIDWKGMVPWLLSSLLLGGTCFFIFPSGLSAAASSFTGFLNGWAQARSIGMLQLAFILATCETLALITAFWSAINAWISKHWIERLLARFWLVCLVLVFLYPGSFPVNLALVSIPMWSLAVIQIERGVIKIPGDKIPSIALAMILFSLFVFGWINLAGGINGQTVGVQAQLRWVSVAGTVIISLLISILVAWGWSPEVGGFGIRCGLLAVLAIFLLFNSWHSADLGRLPEANPWRISGFQKDADLIQNTIEDYSGWNARNILAMDVTVLDVNSMALEWMLRTRENVHFKNGLDGQETPSIIITPDENLPATPAEYTGQDFVWTKTPAWASMTPKNWLEWAFYRKGLYNRQALVLWVRSDLFPGASSTMNSENPQ